MDDLVTWLRAQLDGDERDAQAAANYSAEHGYSFPTDGSGTSGMLAYEHEQHATRHNPARVLREVEAKRRILDLADRLATDAAEILADANAADPGEALTLGATVRDIRRAVALPYSDRPGYREEWRP